MASQDLDFYGLVFFAGYEFFPSDVVLDPNDLRRWAFEQGMIPDPESQLLLSASLQELQTCFSSEDELEIAVAIHESKGKLSYFEYPYLPVKSLIRRVREVEIIYWQMRPTHWDRDGNVLNFGEVRFAFWYPGCNCGDVCSLSTAKRVVEKFDKLFDQLSGTYPVRLFKDGSKEITVDGVVRAKFVKDGRLFDVEFTGGVRSQSQ